MNSAIIGLGLIGAEWAKHLYSDGLLVACWNRSPRPEIPLFEKDLYLLPDKANFLHICVSDPAVVATVIESIKDKLNSRHLVIQSSTIDPTSAEQFQSLVKERGAKYLEAPFTGSLPAAQNRELIYYIGGDEDSIEMAQPYLQKLSKKILTIGDVRQAATLKLSMNLQIAAVLQALVEALTLSRKASIPDQVFFDAFKLNASYSGVAALKESKLRTADFAPQFSIKHMAKDLRLLITSADTASGPFLEELQEIYCAAIEAGFSEEDVSAVIKLCKV